MDNIIVKLLEVKEMLLAIQNKSGGNRELAITITKVDEAVLWRQEDLKRKGIT